VKDKGGLALAVYKPATNNAKSFAEKLVDNGRVHCAIPADYSTDKALEQIVNAKIAEVAARDHLERKLK
jgi:hypothetical protein